MGFLGFRCKHKLMHHLWRIQDWLEVAVLGRDLGRLVDPLPEAVLHGSHKELPARGILPPLPPLSLQLLPRHLEKCISIKLVHPTVSSFIMSTTSLSTLCLTASYMAPSQALPDSSIEQPVSDCHSVMARNIDRPVATCRLLSQHRFLCGGRPA